MGSYLFAQPTFLLGIASLLDFGDSLTQYNTANDGDQADYLALHSDWCAVGDALVTALQELRKEVAATYGAQGEESQPAE